MKWRKKLHTASFSTSGGMCGEVEKGSFTPLVFLTSGGMCGEVEKGSFTPLVSQHLVVCVVKWRKETSHR